MKHIKLYDAYHISYADSAMSNLLDDCDFYKTSDPFKNKCLTNSIISGTSLKLSEVLYVFANLVSVNRE